jgi:hypothetical protein
LNTPPLEDFFNRSYLLRERQAVIVVEETAILDYVGKGTQGNRFSTYSLFWNWALIQETSVYLFLTG